MKKGINLSAEHKRKGKTMQQIFSLLIGIFVFSAITAISLIGYKSYLAWSLGQALQKEREINVQFSQNRLKKEKFMDIHKRLKDIKSVLVNRSKIILKVNDVAQIVPSGASLLSVSGKEELVSVGIQSENLSVLNDLIEQKIVSIASDKKKDVKKIEMRSFILNPKTLQYEVDFAVTFN